MPTAWIERIFLRLTSIYGREFIKQYSTGVVDGVDLGVEDAKQVWAEELWMFSDRPDAIKFALANLPDRPPNAIRFRDLARQAPRQEEAQLLTKKLSEEEKAANRARLAEIMAKIRVNQEA